MAERLREEVRRLEEEVKRLREFIAEREREARRKAFKLQAKLLMEQLFLPYFEGLSETLGLTPAEAVKTLIEKDITLDTLASRHSGAFQEFLSQPEVKVAVAMAGRVANKPDEWFKEKLPTLLEVMEESAPELAEAIKKTKGGRSWLLKSLTGLRDLLFGGR